MKKELENKTEEVKMKKPENEKALQKHLDGIKLYDGEIPKLDKDYKKDSFIPKTNEFGVCEWESCVQDVWDCRGFALLKIKNIMDIISTSGLVAISAMYKAFPSDFGDIIEDVYHDTPRTHWKNIIKNFDKKILIEIKEEQENNVNMNRVHFYSKMHNISVRLMRMEEHLDEAVEIYSIESLLFEIINQLSKVIGKIFLQENIEDLLIKRFNESILNKWLMEICNLKTDK